jgi:DNA-binding MarR family transcriptional regulator
VKKKDAPLPRLAKSHYELLSSLRHALRGFMRFSQDAARAAGLTPQQHQALLAIKGFPGRDFASVGEIADRLHLRPHSAVGLVDRLAHRGLVRRVPSKADGRRIEIHLTAKGEKVIGRLSASHFEELRQLSPELRQLLAAIPR